MATAIWDLRRRGAPGGSICPGRVRRGPSAADRRRLTFLALAVAVGLLTTLPSALDLAGLSGPYDKEPHAPPEGGDETPPIRAVVQSGDTIWDIAAPHVPEGTSLQDYVAEILLINDVDPAELQPGSVLDLPQR